MSDVGLRVPHWGPQAKLQTFTLFVGNLLLKDISSPSSCCSDECDFEQGGNVAICQCMADTRLQVSKMGEGGGNPSRLRREPKLSCVATLGEPASKGGATGPCQALVHQTS